MKLINSSGVAWSPQRAKGEMFSPNQTPENLQKKTKQGTTHDSANSKPLYQKKIQIFVNFMLKFY